MSDSAKYIKTNMASFTYNTPAGVSSSRVNARAAAGQLDKNPTCDGYWVHVAIANTGVPRRATILYVDGGEFCTVEDAGHTAMKSIDKLPTGGFYIFLYPSGE